MTDDTLREECEKWVLRNAHPRYNNTEFAWRVRALESFARAQQAKGLMEAAQEVSRKLAQCDIASIYTVKELPRLKSWLDAQATAREKHT